MSESTQNPGYLMLIRGNWVDEISPTELEGQMRLFVDWVNGMRERGILRGANPLEEVGVSVTGGKGSRTVTDGPFAESKEAVGGYFYLDVNSLEDAIEEAKACPALDYGCSMEVRPVAEMCPHIVRLGLADALNYK